MKSSFTHIRPIIYALAGFFFWVLADTCMKLAGEAHLPFYEVVGALGFFAALTLFLIYAPQGKVRLLWPKNPKGQGLRVLMAFGCLTCNAIALNHLPLTMFYIVIFTSPILIAIMAAFFLQEHLSTAKILAVIAGFAGVVIAIEPWNHAAGGDWIGYAAGIGSALFFAVAAVMLRFMSKTETPLSITFFTALMESIMGLILMLWHAEPVTPYILAILALMGSINVLGNLGYSYALKDATAATVEQFHYSQIIIGAVIGYIIWHDVPTDNTIIGAIVIIASGLYVAASVHRDGKKLAVENI